MEGKETRFGIANSALWAAATTAASNGSVNSMHGSFTPLGGLVPMWLMQLGEVVFGGVGSGLYGMLMFAIVAVFIAGPDGRAHARVPRQEDRGLRDEDGLARAADPLPRRAARHGDRERAARRGRREIGNPGPHGFSEILYAFSSAGNNNGSAFGGLSANNPFYNFALGVAMWISRYWLMIPVLAIAGSLAAKRDRGGDRRHAADAHAAVRRHAGRRRAAGRRADLRAGARAGARRRAPADGRSLRHRAMSNLPPTAVASSLPRSSGPGSLDAFRKLDPRVQVRNPVMFVVYVGSLLTTVLGVLAAGRRRPGRRPSRLRALDRRLAVAHGAVRQLRRGRRRGSRQGAGRGAALDAPRRASAAARCRDVARSSTKGCRPTACAGASSSWSRPARSSRPTAKWSRAWPRSTRAPSPANRRPCCARPAATSRR